MTFIAQMEEEGYQHVRKLPTGPYVGLSVMFYTTALVVGLTNSGYAKRYCYANPKDAIVAIQTWDGIGDPPGPWIKMKSCDGERQGPGSQQT